jgi:hypothetical protein
MAPRFAVTLLIGKSVAAELEAPNERAAEDIARFMIGYDPQFFRFRDEDIMDVLIDTVNEGAAS